MSHIFISYNQEDADFASVLSNNAERAGIDTWVDKDRLRPGQDWSDKIDDAINKSAAVVVIMSPSAKASEYVTYEWSFALGAGVKVIPILYKETALHPRLGRLHYLKFTDSKVRPWDELIQAIMAAVAESGSYEIRLPRTAPTHIKSAVLALDSANLSDRKGAIRVLSSSDNPSAKEALVSALRHPIPDVRWAASVHLPDSDLAVPVLIEAFLNRAQGIDAPLELARHRQVAFDALVELLRTFSPSPPVDLEKLRLHLPEDAEFSDLENDRSRDVGYDLDYIVTAFRYFPSKLLSRLIDFLHDPSPTLREGAALAQRYNESDLAHQELRKLLNDPDVRMRAAAVQSLGKNKRFKDDDDVFLLALRDESFLVYSYAQQVLSRSQRAETGPKLVEMMRGKSAKLALRAYQLLLHNNQWPEQLKDWRIQTGDSLNDAQPGTYIYLDRNVKLIGEPMLHAGFYVLVEKQDAFFKLAPLSKDLVGRHVNLSAKHAVYFEPTGIVADISTPSI